MDADRAQSPPAGPGPAAPSPGPTPGDVGPGRVEVAGRLGLLDRSDGPWIPIDHPVVHLAHADPPNQPDPPTDRARTRRRLPVAYAVMAALLLVGVAVGIGTHSRLGATDDQLAAVRARLHLTISRSHRAEQRLATVTSQSAAAGATLATETSQLAAVQARLAATEVNVFTNGVSINQLDTCVAGVERALNQISLNDQHGAAVSLDGVAAACRAAEPSP